MRSQAWRPSGGVRNFFHAPTAADWYQIAAAIREGWNVMLCWDTNKSLWRCDFIRRGQLAYGEGGTIAEASAAAWEATGPELDRIARDTKID